MFSNFENSFEIYNNFINFFSLSQIFRAINEIYEAGGFDKPDAPEEEGGGREDSV